MKGKKQSEGKRSAVVSVRLDPKLRFATELAARKQRRTVSSYIEWAVEQAIKAEANEGDPFSETIKAVVDCVWDVDDADRFVKLASTFPVFLTHQEQVLWKLIKECRGLNKGEDGLGLAEIRKHWPSLIAVSQGEMKKSDLPDDVLEGIPF